MCIRTVNEMYFVYIHKPSFLTLGHIAMSCTIMIQSHCLHQSEQLFTKLWSNHRSIVCLMQYSYIQISQVVAKWRDKLCETLDKCFVWLLATARATVIRNISYFGHTKLMLCFTDYLPSQSDPAGREKNKNVKLIYIGLYS